MEGTTSGNVQLGPEARNVGAEGIGFSGEQLAKPGRKYVEAGYEEHGATAGSRPIEGSGLTVSLREASPSRSKQSR